MYLCVYVYEGMYMHVCVYVLLMHTCLLTMATFHNHP